MSARVYILFAALAHVLYMGQCKAQLPLSLDTNFRVDAQEINVTSILPLLDGKVITSGRLRFQNSPSVTTRLARLNTDGSRDPTFYESGLGGSTLTRWNDRFYAGSQTVRRILMDGYPDSTFIQMNSGPYFSSAQGGDYHVFPDGRLLLSGLHLLEDSVRGFMGFYNLIWFSNTGYLDTTRTHRASTGATDEIQPLANGQFLVYGSGSQYEGQSVGRIFRIGADGSLDPTLQTGVNWGAAYSFLPLDDGRFYAAGIFTRIGFPNDTLRLVRFLSDGALDPTFNNHIPFSKGVLTSPFGALPTPVQPWNNGSILVMGAFQFVDGQARRGICVIDSTGQLMDEFDGCGAGPYVYQGFTYGSIEGMAPGLDGKVYIWGAYHGYNDGSTNDTIQRFITRLYGPDFTTAVSEVPATDSRLTLFPNPTTGRISFTYAPSGEGKSVVVQDLVGRVVHTRSFQAHTEQFEMDLSGLAQGNYVVRLYQGERTLGMRQVVLCAP